MRLTRDELEAQNRRLRKQNAELALTVAELERRLKSAQADGEFWKKSCRGVSMLLEQRLTEDDNPNIEDNR